MHYVAQEAQQNQHVHSKHNIKSLEVSASGSECAAKVNIPVFSHEAKQDLVMVAGIVAIIGLGVGLRYVIDVRMQRHRREQTLEDFAFKPVLLPGTIGHWWVVGFCSVLELGQLTP